VVREDFHCQATTTIDEVRSGPCLAMAIADTGITVAVDLDRCAVCMDHQSRQSYAVKGVTGIHCVDLLKTGLDQW